MYTVLVVEDDEHIGCLFEELLTDNDFRVVRAYSGTEAVLAGNACRPNLILLDLMLPGADGRDVLKALLPTPVIIVSAVPDPEQKAELLLRGACDYVTKPFYTNELLARITVALRRTSENSSGLLSFGGVSLDPDLFTAAGPAGEVHLTRTETALLRLFLSEPSRIFSKSFILDRIATDTPDCTEASLKMHVSNLRRKLRQVGAPGSFIESVWGIGYRLHPDATF